MAVVGVRQYLDRQYVPTHPLKPGTVYQYGRSLTLFCETVGSEPDVDVVTSDMLARALVLLDKSKGPRTRKRVRDTVLTILRHAERAGQRGPVGYVDRVKVPSLIPEAWSIEEVRLLIVATGYLSRHGTYFDGLVRSVWDTALRRADVESLQIGSRRETTFAVRQEKTGEPILVTLRPETIRVLRQLPGRPCPLRWRLSGRQRYYWWEKLCKLADVPHGATQRLRRSAATAVEMIHPGSATYFLGHKSADLARRHYLDPRLLQRNLFRPPAL